MVDKETLDLLELDDLNEKNRELAEVLGMEAFRKLLLWGSGTGAMYIPKISRVIIPVRDQLIRREYNGYNVYKLAKKWDLSDATIRQIVKEKSKQLKRAPPSGQISFEEIQKDE